MKKETQIAKFDDKKFGIYKFEKEKLFFGQLTKENDGSAANKRPLTLSPDFYIKSLLQSQLSHRIYLRHFDTF